MRDLGLFAHEVSQQDISCVAITILRTEIRQTYGLVYS